MRYFSRQSSMFYPLICFAFLVLTEPLLHSQLASAALTFEVASIKPNRSGAIPSTMGVAPTDGPTGCHGTDRGPQAIPLGRCMFTNVTAGFMISVVSIMDNKEYHVSGLPGWVTTEGFDIEAKADHPVTQIEFSAMLKSLLVERFKCTFHPETREVSGFALVAATKGSKVEPADNQEPQTAKDANTSVSIADALTHRSVLASKARPTRALLLSSSKATMAKLASVLSESWPAPIVDATGLDGYYKFQLRWQPEGGSDVIDRTDPSLPTALQEQLGLKLEPRKVAIEFLVIDHIEKPTFN